LKRIHVEDIAGTGMLGTCGARGEGGCHWSGLRCIVIRCWRGRTSVGSCIAYIVCFTPPDTCTRSLAGLGVRIKKIAGPIGVRVRLLAVSLAYLRACMRVYIYDIARLRELIALLSGLRCGSVR
jgi:hypothetical protein